MAGAHRLALTIYVHHSMPLQEIVYLRASQPVREGPLTGREYGMGQAVWDRGRVMARVQHLTEQCCIARHELWAGVHINFKHLYGLSSIRGWESPGP
jgi:hypothetical protein